MTQATETSVPALGLLARITGTIFSPESTFRSAVAHPRPAGVLFVTCLVMALAMGLPQFTESGRQAALDMQVQQTERFTGEPITPEDYSRMESFSRNAGYFTMGIMFVTIPVFCLIGAAIWWALLNITLGGTATFKQVLTVVTHSQVILALGAAAGAPIQFATGTFSPAGPFNLGALAPMLEPGTFGATFLTSLSIFTLWQLVVQGIGLAVLYRRGRLGIVLAVVVVGLAIAAAIAAATS